MNRTNWGSWRTSLTGAINLLLGVGLIACIPVIPALTPFAVPVGAMGMGLMTAGVQGLVGRDNKVRSESVMTNSELHDSPKK